MAYWSADVCIADKVENHSKNIDLRDSFWFATKLKRNIYVMACFLTYLLHNFKTSLLKMFLLHFLNPKLYNHFKCITATPSMPPYTFKPWTNWMQKIWVNCVLKLKHSDSFNKHLMWRKVYYAVWSVFVWTNLFVWVRQTVVLFHRAIVVSPPSNPKTRLSGGPLGS